MFLAACEDFVEEQFDMRWDNAAQSGKQIEVDRVTRDHEAWRATLDRDRRKARPDPDLDNPAGIAATLWPAVLTALSVAVEHVTAVTRGDRARAAEPFGLSNDVLIQQWQASMAVGW